MDGGRISEALVASGGRLRCAACGHDLAPAGAPWKGTAALTERSVAAMPGAGRNVEPRLVLRHFGCPGCGRLLDTETALPEDPFLDDVISA